MIIALELQINFHALQSSVSKQLGCINAVYIVNVIN